MEELAPSAGWCWFHAARSISVGDRTYAGSVRRDDGDRAVVSVLVLDHATGQHAEVLLEHDAVLDDHNAPGIAHLDGHRFAVGWTGHYATPTVQLRVLDLRDPHAPVVEQSLSADAGAPATYVALAPRADGTVDVFTRSLANNPTTMRWDPEAGEVSAPRRWLAQPYPTGSAHHSGIDGGRPYLVFQRSGSVLHVAASPDHPRAYRTGVYVGSVEGDEVRDAHGAVVGRLGEGTAPLLTDALTEVLPSGDDPAWVHDVAVVDGVLTVAYTTASRTSEQFVLPDIDKADGALTYWIAEMVDGRWERSRVAHAGAPLYAAEADYAGGITLSRARRGQCAVSSSVDPLTGAATDDSLHHVYLMRRDSGDAWHASRVSGPPSGRASIRPVYSDSLDDGAHSLLWLAGDYRRFTDYDLVVRGVVHRQGSTCHRAGGEHVDSSFPPLGVEMPPDEVAELRSQLQRCSRYLEYGAGGSTALAVALGVADILSVESDYPVAADLDALLRQRLTGGQSLQVIHADIGTTIEWGHPLLPMSGEPYAAAPSDARPGWSPDLVLVDGRYRAASFLHALGTAAPGATILFDDFADRPMYQPVLEAIAPARLVGRMAVFEVDAPVTVDPRLIESVLHSPW